MPRNSHALSRRQFLQAGTCGTMTLGPLINTVAQLSLVDTALAPANAVGFDPTQYKALVCLFLSGGCDSNNLLIPRGSHAQAGAYANGRGIVGIPNGVASPSNPGGNDATLPIPNFPGEGPMGMHPEMPNLAAMLNAGEAAFVTNVGTLVEPVTSDSYELVELPKQLFSHSDQRSQWMSSISDQDYTSGWGARVADLYHDTWNGDTPTSMLITASGNNAFLNGGGQSSYSVTSDGAISLVGYQQARTASGDYADNSQGHRLKALEQIMRYSRGHILQQGYADSLKDAWENEALVNTSATHSVNQWGFDIDAFWTSHGLTDDLKVAEEFKAIAKIIAGRSVLQNNRQIFFIDVQGYDHHASINEALPVLLRELDQGIGVFNAFLKRLAEVDASFGYDQVSCFQCSDFNRTWTPNGGGYNTAGTDHAWGGHYWVFGGAVQGGSYYGSRSFPDLEVGSRDDLPLGARGRWIPTTSVDQYAATMAHWLGVPLGSTEMSTIFPNLGRFPEITSAAANLGLFA